MKKLLFSVLLLSALNALAQNFYVPHVLNIPKLPTPTWQIEWADVDLNGYADLVNANDATHELLIYPNTNGVVDSVPLSYPAAIAEFWLTDWNNDGRMDVVYSTANNSQLELIINNSAGGFFSPVSLSGNPSGQFYFKDITFQDLNADNFPDIVLNRIDTIFLLLNNAGSTALTAQTVGLPYHSSANFSDFDNDGDLDLVTIPQVNGFYRKAVIYENTGSYNFTAVDTVAFTNGANDIDYLYCYDLNNDGTNEILAISSSQLYVAQKTTGFQFNQIHTSSFYFQVAATGQEGHRGICDFADVDGNGFKDLVVANSVYFNTNAILTRADILASPDFYDSYIKVVDTDNDGVNELWWNMYQYYADGFSFVYSLTYNTGTTFYPRVRRWNVNPYIAYEAYENYLDFDGDGDRDFLYHSAGRVMVAVNDGNDNFTDQTVIAPTGIFNADVQAVDVDQDGLPDILQTNGVNFSSYWITYWHNNGNLQFQNMGNIINTTYPRWPYLLAHEDLDNDGMRDFVFIYTNGIQTVEIEVVKNNTTTFTSQGIIYTANQASDIHPVHCDISDLDNNGFKDLFIDYNSGVVGNHGRYAVLLNNGAFSFSNPLNIPFNNVDYGVGLADVNSDGLEDLLVSRYDNFFQTSRIKARINNGNGTFGGEINVSAPYSPNYGDFFTTDVNNDGLKDVVTGYDFSVAINNGSGFNTWIQNGTAESSGSEPVQMDIDGDGDMDLVNGDTHTWFDNTAVSPNRINGTVFYDVNTNGTKDAGDIALQNFPVSTIPLVAISNTDSSGLFSMRMGSSTGTFAVQSKSKWNSNFTFTTNPYPDSATINSSNPVDNVSIGFYAPGGIHQALLDQAISSHRCNAQARLWINTTNFSPLSSALTVQLTLPPNVSYLNSSIPPSSQVGNQITWNISAASFEEKNFWLNINMPNFNFTGDTINFISTLASTQGSATINVNDTLPVVLTCAFDPNDKLTVPLSTQLSGDKLYVFDDYVEYQVRFQNTGTDTAQTVVIKDLLNNNFDLSSIEIISASNDFSFMVENNRLLTVTFNNIQLPDSGTNFTGSMGYVKFGIRLLPNTPHNVVIRNFARIYFDQNDPVYTNAVDIYRVACPDFITPVYSSAGFCSGTSYTAHINNHNLNAQYTWSLDGNIITTNDSAQFAITHTGNNLINIHIDLGVCQYDSLRTFNVSQTATALTLNAPADTAICPNIGISLNSNFSSNWYINDSLVAANSFGTAAYGGDTVVAIYISGFCVSRAQTILNDLFPMQPELLTSPDVPGNTLNSCESTTLHLQSANNVAWTWNLDNDTTVHADTATSINIFIDPMANSGGFIMMFDTLVCSYAEYYSINVIHAATVPIVMDSGNIIVCSGNPATLNYYNPFLDSLQIYLGGVYDTTLYNLFNATNFSLSAIGAYIAIGYTAECAHPPLNFSISLSTAPYPTVTVINNVLYTSDGSIANWFYSVDNTTFNYIGTYDTLPASQPEGYYYFDALNADGCYGFSPVYHFLFTGINEFQNENVSILYNASVNAVFISGLTQSANPQLTIYNEQGQSVYHIQALSKNELPLLAAGVYVVMLKTEKGVYVSRLVTMQ